AINSIRRYTGAGVVERGGGSAMVQRKCFLGTARGIVAYEAEDEGGGQIRFRRVAHAMPDLFFSQSVVDVESGLIFTGATPGEFPLEPGTAQQRRAKPRYGPVLYRSSDGGGSWEPSDEGITAEGIRTIALDRSTGYL